MDFEMQVVQTNGDHGASYATNDSVSPSVSLNESLFFSTIKINNQNTGQQVQYD